MDTLDILVKFLDNEGFLVLLGRAENRAVSRWCRLGFCSIIYSGLR